MARSWRFCDHHRSHEVLQGRKPFVLGAHLPRYSSSGLLCAVSHCTRGRGKEAGEPERQQKHATSKREYECTQGIQEVGMREETTQLWPSFCEPAHGFLGVDSELGRLQIRQRVPCLVTHQAPQTELRLLLPVTGGPKSKPGGNTHIQIHIHKHIHTSTESHPHIHSSTYTFTSTSTSTSTQPQIHRSTTTPTR